MADTSADVGAQKQATAPRRIRMALLLTVLVLPELVALCDFVEPILGWWPTVAILAALQLPMILEVRGIAAHREASPVELLGWQLFYALWTGALFYATLAGPTRLGLLLTTGDVGVAGSLAPWWLGSFPFAASAFGVFIGQHLYQRRPLSLVLAGLPESWSGLRVVHLSDIHTGRFITARRLRMLARRAAAARPDLVVVTGDIVDTNAAFAPLAARALMSIPARFGVFAVLGNHDHYAGGVAVRRALADAGVRVLTNEGVSLWPDARGSDARGSDARGPDTRGESRLSRVSSREGSDPGSKRADAQPLYLAGVDDLWSGADLEAALSQRPAGAASILLSHQPNLFPEAAARGVALTLCGHTHGGQVAVPGWRAFSLARLITRYVSGLYRIGDSLLYVNNGAGVIRPLVRIGARPEVAVLTLVSRAVVVEDTPRGSQAIA